MKQEEEGNRAVDLIGRMLSPKFEPPEVLGGPGQCPLARH